MTKVPKRDETRDQELIKAYLDKDIPMSRLNGKYKISSTRIYQILDHYKIKRRTSK